MTLPSFRYCGLLGLLVLNLPLAALRAQVASTPVRPLASAVSDDAVLLSPFEVSTSADVGYQAGNTTSGSRLNAKLKDTAAPVSVFTKEFLSDFAVTNLEEMMAYSGNFEKDFEDSNAGFNAPSLRGSSAATPPFRIRGLTGSFGVDLVESAVPQDIYNIDRVEVSSGPNSVLFGLGAAGGTVSLTSKQADVRRDATQLKFIAGSWNFQRAELDSNLMLVRKKLAFRLNALDAHANSWREYDFSKSRRVAASVTYQLRETTTLRFAWDGGTHDRHTDWTWPAGDGVRGWMVAGRPTINSATTPFNANNFAALGINRVTTNTQWTFIDNNPSMVNMQNQLQSFTGNNPNGVAYSTDGLLTPYSPPVKQSFSGPGSLLHGFYRNYSAKAEHRWGKLILEGAFIHTFNKSKANGWAVPGNSINLRADPNATLPTPSGALVANPNVGKFYIENTWRPEDTAFKNEVFRLTAAYEQDFGKWLGRHRVAGLGEVGKIDQIAHVYQEILVNQNNVPLANAATPEGAQNMLWRRHYATEGDFSTYHQGDLRIPAQSFTVGTNTYSTRYVAFNQAGNAENLKLTDTWMIADQGYFWKDRIITTLGYRVDQVKFKNGLTGRLTATDPAVLNGSGIVNEFYSVPGQFTQPQPSFRPHTFTAGVVVHPTSRLSAFYNRSDNVGAPSFTARILPPEAPPLNLAPPQTTGKSRDYGVMFDLLGDDRYFLRLTRFDTLYLNSTPIQPGTNVFQAAQGLGQGLDALVAGGRITAAQAAPFRVNPTAFSIDTASKGIELEAIANPNRNISLRANFSYSDRNRENFAKEIPPFVEKLYAFLGTVNSTGVLSNFGQNTTANPARTAKQMIIDEIDAFVDQTGTNQTQAFGSRPYKLNIDGRYKFTEGSLKGFAVGGAVRWASNNYMQMDLRTTLDGGATNPNYGKKLYGHTQEAWDFFTNYRLKADFLGKKNLTFQLNVRNAFNQSRVLPARYTNDFLALRRVYLNDPRSFRFTTTVEF